MAVARKRARTAAEASAAAASAPAPSKSQRRRAEIVARATEIFDRQGYANTSLDDIARAVGIAREGIYYYFGNRAEILLAIIAPQSRALIDGLKRILADPALDPPARLAAAVRNHLEQFDRYCLEMTVSLRDGLLEEAGDVRSAMRRIWKEYERLWTRLIDEGQRAGAFRAIGDPKMLAFGALGMCNWLARWYDPKKGRPIGELVDAYTAMLAGGLVNAGGRGSG
jgi:TetR/AcrR family transcriptional regulator, cholesterol catabolism regulator